MISIETEHLLTLAEACTLLPRRRAGKKCAVSTLHRWRLRGIRGVRLESAMLGGIRMTSVQAIQRFMDRVSSRSEREVPEFASRTSEARDRQLAKVDAELEMEGF